MWRMAQVKGNQHNVKLVDGHLEYLWEEYNSITSSFKGTEVKLTGKIEWRLAQNDE